MKSIFDDDERDGALLVGANNAFNSFNHASIMHSTRILCSSIAAALINMYPTNAELSKHVILSEEGTTLGLAMAMYAARANQVYFAENSLAEGCIHQLQSRKDRPLVAGPDVAKM